MDMIRFSFVQILDILGDVSVSKLLGFKTFPFFRWLQIRNWKNLVSKKSIGFGIENILYQKSIGFGIGKNLVSGKSFGFGFRSDFGYRHTLVGGTGG